MLQRDTTNAPYEQILLNTQPNTILYFGSGSALDVFSSSLFYMTCSNALTTSFFTGSVSNALVAVSSSYSLSASWAPGTGGGTAGSASWASSSFSSSYSSYSVSASHALIADTAINATNATNATTATDVVITGVGVNTQYDIVITQGAGSSQGLDIDAAHGIEYNPGTETLTVPYITATIQGTASCAVTASSVLPGTMLWTVSGSNGIPPAYLQPYDFSSPAVNYLPPYYPGRTFWDNRYLDWAWYAPTASGATFFRMHLGKEVSMGVHNPYPFTLPRLSAVYIGTSSLAETYQPDVYLAVADGSGRANVAGIIRSDILSGSTGFMLQSGVMHRTNVGSLTVGQQLWLSPTVPGGYVTSNPGQPYDQVLIGYCSETGSLGSIICDRIIYPPPPTAYAGVTSNIVVTNNNDGTATISTGSVNLFSNPQGSGLVTAYQLSQTTFTLATGSNVDNYIVAQLSGSSTTAWYQLLTNRTSIDNITIVPVVAINARYEGPGQWELHQFNFGSYGLALANKENYKDAILNATERQAGLTLFAITGSGTDFGVTAGAAWYGVNLATLGAFQSSNSSSCDTYHYISSASNWTYTTTVGYDNGNYNDPAIGLVPLNALSWSVNFVYRIIDTSGNSDVALVLSSQQFDNLLDAEANSQPPPNLPTFFTDFGLLVGALYVQSGSTSPIIRSAYTTQFAPDAVTQHNSLLGIQGGIGNQYYHLTAADYTGTGTGLIMRAYKPQFQAATPYNIPFYDISGSLTLTGSIFVLNNNYLTINSASTTVGNPEALLVKQVSTTSENCIGAYATVNDFSQIYNQNQSSGSEASTDMVCTSDTGNELSSYIDLGIGSSGYSSSRWPWVKALDGYIQMQGGDLWLATNSDNKLRFTFNNTSSKNYADKTGFYLSGSWYGTASWANNAISSSYSATASYVASASFYPTTIASASFASSSLSASYISGSGTGSFYGLFVGVHSGSLTGTSSWAAFSLQSNVSTASLFTSQSNFAASASWASGSITASYVSGSGTGSFYGSFIGVHSGSLTGTASFAVSASWAPGAGTSLTTGSTYPVTASWSIFSIQSGISTSSLFASQSNFAISSSWASGSLSASYVSGSGTGSFYGLFVGTHSGSLTGTASFAVSASWAPGGTGTGLSTGSTYPITASWANNSLSASYLNGLGTGSFTGSFVGILTGTSSYATSASYSTSASYAPSSGTSLTTGSTYPVTASWSVLSIQSNISTSSLFASQSNFSVSASWASGSLSASYISGSGTGSFYGLFVGVHSGSLIGTASQATSASWSPVQFVGGTMSTGSTFPITASWAIFGVQTSIATSSLFASQSSFSVSSSWASGSLSSSYISGSGTGSFYGLFVGAHSGSLVGTSSQATSASYAFSSSWSPVQFIGGTMSTGSTFPITASWSVSASWAPGGTGTGLATGSTYPFTSSWAVSASWAPGGTGTGLATGSTYPFTASWAQTASVLVGSIQSATFATSASFASSSISSSYALSASWAPGGTGAGGLATGSTYPITASNAVTASYALTATATIPQTLSVQTITASINLLLGPGSDDSGVTLYVSASNRSTANIMEVDDMNGSEAFQIAYNGVCYLSSSGTQSLNIQNSTNNESAVVNQNLNSGNTASADFIVTNNNGNLNTYLGGYYVDLGINSSGYNYPFVGTANDSYLFVTSSNSSSFFIGNLDLTGDVFLFAGGNATTGSGLQVTPSSVIVNLPFTASIITASVIHGGLAATINFNLNSGLPLTLGDKGNYIVPNSMSLSSWQLLCNPSGSIAIEVQWSNYANFPTFTSLTNGNFISSSVSYKNQGTMAGWTSSLSTGDIVKFIVTSSNSKVTNLNLILQGIKYV